MHLRNSSFWTIVLYFFIKNRMIFLHANTLIRLQNTFSSVGDVCIHQTDDAIIILHVMLWDVRYYYLQQNFWYVPHLDICKSLYRYAIVVTTIIQKKISYLCLPVSDPSREVSNFDKPLDKGNFYSYRHEIKQFWYCQNM